MEEGRKRPREDFDESHLEGDENKRVRRELEAEGVDVDNIEYHLLSIPRDYTSWYIFLRMDVPTIIRLCSVSRVVHTFCHEVLGVMFWRAVVLGDLYVSMNPGLKLPEIWKQVIDNFDKDDVDYWKGLYKDRVTSASTTWGPATNVLEQCSKSLRGVSLWITRAPSSTIGYAISTEYPARLHFMRFGANTEKILVIDLDKVVAFGTLPNRPPVDITKLPHLSITERTKNKEIMSLGAVDASYIHTGRFGKMLEINEYVRMFLMPAGVRIPGKDVVSGRYIQLKKVPPAVVCRIMLDPINRIKALNMRKSDLEKLAETISNAEQTQPVGELYDFE